MKKLFRDYYNYKKFIEFPMAVKGLYDNCKKVINILYLNRDIVFIEYEWNTRLRYVRIFFDTPTFDRITKDRAAKFVDMLSAIGGTMGLLTGFSIISGVEIIYFLLKSVMNVMKVRK